MAHEAVKWTRPKDTSKPAEILIEKPRSSAGKCMQPFKLRMDILNSKEPYRSLRKTAVRTLLIFQPRLFCFSHNVPGFLFYSSAAQRPGDPDSRFIHV